MLLWSMIVSFAPFKSPKISPKYDSDLIFYPHHTMRTLNQSSSASRESEGNRKRRTEARVHTHTQIEQTDTIMSLVDITTTESLAQALGGDHKKKAVLLFGATWHEACPKLRMVLQALASSQKDDNKLVFGYVDAETSPLSDVLGVTLVPTLILLNSGGGGSDDELAHNVLERLEGGVLEPAQVTLAVQRLTQAPEGYTLDATAATVPTEAQSTNEVGATDNTTTTNKTLQDRLERLIRGDTVMLFMKGRPDAPRCGFSRQAVEVLKEQEVPFGSFDILSDEDVRQGLKKLSDWPTYPQIVSF